MDVGGLTFRLLGQGIAYSASPAMMAAAFAALGLPHRYEHRGRATRRGRTPPSSACATPDAGGANVTTPHKAAVAALVDELSDRMPSGRAPSTSSSRDGAG